MADNYENFKKFADFSKILPQEDMDLAGFTKGTPWRVKTEKDRIIIRILDPEDENAVKENKPMKEIKDESTKKIKEIFVKETQTKITLYPGKIVFEKSN